MKLEYKYMAFCAVLLIILPVFLSTINSDEIMNTDWVYRHTKWIDYYLKGDFRPILDYPPLFHWLMMPFVAINFPVKWLQVVFMVLTLAGILYYLKNYESEKTTLLVLMMLATSIVFVEYAGVLMPQGLDYFLFPIMLVLYYRGKDSMAIALGIITTLMHTIGLIFIGIIFIHALLTRRSSWKKWLIGCILVFPIFLFYFLPTSHAHLLSFAWDSATQAKWDAQFLEPVNFVIHSGFLILIMIPFAVNSLRKKKFKLNEKQLLYVIWILAFIVLWIGNYGVWRMISYQILPLALLVGSLVSEDESIEY